MLSLFCFVGNPFLLLRIRLGSQVVPVLILLAPPESTYIRRFPLSLPNPSALFRYSACHDLLYFHPRIRYFSGCHSSELHNSFRVSNLDRAASYSPRTAVALSQNIVQARGNYEFK